MNISDLFSAGRVEQFKSIEENLLNRKQNGKIAGTLALITAIGQAFDFVMADIERDFGRGRRS